MNNLSNQELYRILDIENKKIEEFRIANPQFKLDSSNIASSEEINYFEQLYSQMNLGSLEVAPSAFHFKRCEAYTFKQIFSDNFDSFLVRNPSLNIRPCVISEVRKMISCQDPSLGYAIYQCPSCQKYFSVPFTCKSRFCNTCSIKYQQDRSLQIASKLIRCKHRHLVFTIPEQLRVYFRKDRYLLNVLFHSAENCIQFFFHKRAPKKNLLPGIILVLHTFGRDLKWNPHIHCLVTEGASSNIKNCPSNDIWISLTHFDYEGFRKSFQYCLLSSMKNYLQSTLSTKEFNTFKTLVNSLYHTYDNGFYVRAKPFDGNPDHAISYLLRYFNRPAMAQSRILFYDGSYVVFYYQRHEDDMFVIEKVPVFDLIQRLIIHIPDQNFKMLRYAGIYSSHKCAHFEKLIKKLSEATLKLKKSLANWHSRIQINFHYDPLICPFCHSTMYFSELVIANSSA